MIWQRNEALRGARPSLPIARSQPDPMPQKSADEANRLKILKSYLDHIRIAIEAGDRGAPFRDLFDNWNVHRSESNHHRTRGGRPKWFNNPCAVSRSTMLDSLDFRSSGAADIMMYAKADPNAYLQRCAAGHQEVRLIVDHAVPVSVIRDMLFDARQTSATELDCEQVEFFLIRWFRLGLISKMEDIKLSRLKLASKMPDIWDRADPFVRYRAAEIQLSA